ncbi:MAG: hypothetical protein C0404_12135 [Verrucomicrobia bacterium]|nr:hypothetical protein [Verrucomicrobiota bacterium]
MRKSSSRKKKVLKKMSVREVWVFKIANRRGYAAIARKNLTEGRSVAQAYSRLAKAIRRTGYELPLDKCPSAS